MRCVWPFNDATALIPTNTPQKKTTLPVSSSGFLRLASSVSSAETNTRQTRCSFLFFFFFVFFLQGQTKVKRAGQCCDECAVAKGSCLYEDAVRYHGDMWNGTGCEFCSCNRGQVLCRRAECGRVECPQVRENLKE